MPSMPAQVTGKTYRAMADTLQHAAGQVNGYATVPDPEDATGTKSLAVPALKNMHVVAIFQALRRAAARGADSWALADWEWLWFALGWHSLGDKFVDTSAQASGAYDADILPEFWAWVDKTCDRLDELRTVVRPLYLGYKFPSDYQQAERDGWEAMKRLTPLGGTAPVKPASESAYVMPGDIVPPGGADNVPIVPPSIPTVGKGFAFLVLLALLASTSKRRKR